MAWHGQHALGKGGPPVAKRGAPQGGVRPGRCTAHDIVPAVKEVGAELRVERLGLVAWGGGGGAVGAILSCCWWWRVVWRAGAAVREVDSSTAQPSAAAGGKE